VLSQKQSCSFPQPSGLLHATAPVQRGSGGGQPLLQYMHSWPRPGHPQMPTPQAHPMPKQLGNPQVQSGGGDMSHRQP